MFGARGKLFFLCSPSKQPNRRNRVTNRGKVMTTKSIKRISITTLAIMVFAAVNATAQTYELRGATNRQLRTLITSIENRTDAFKVEMQRSFSVGGTTNREDRITD